MTIFVTGIGAISAIGNNCDEIFQSLKNGVSRISKLEFLKTIHSDLPCGEIKMSYEQLADMAEVDKESPLVRTPLMGLIAVKEALNSAKLNYCSSLKPEDSKNEKYIDNHGLRIAFVSGTTVGGMDRMEQFYDDFVNNDSKNFYLYPHDIGDSSEYIAEKIGIFSYVSSISTACSSGANAIMFGAELINSGRFDIVVAGGAESISLYHFNGFNSLMILSNELCKPFDANRKGLNLGEGAGYVVLESKKAVKMRGAYPICKLTGYGNTCDAFHQTATSDEGDGAYLAMSQAISCAKISPKDIDYINCHGTSTPNNDKTEGVAMKRVFGNVPDFSSTKSFTGHTTSASGGLEAVISIMCLNNNFLPKNLNFETPIPELGISPLTSNKEKPLKHVMTNSFGFGGNDTSLIFSRLEE